MSLIFKRDLDAIGAAVDALAARVAGLRDPKADALLRALLRRLRAAQARGAPPMTLRDLRRLSGDASALEMRLRRLPDRWVFGETEPLLTGVQERIARAMNRSAGREWQRDPTTGVWSPVVG